eukprot:GHVL01008860.1.p1 GENE.GHVL01008860.1~~GHVL01008860.1.p1  ORF type:complete len:149 (+),score=26.92 GHVL01008860.1:28-474(+)
MRKAAGIVLWHKLSGECKFLLLKNKNRGHWSFPKGHLLTGESMYEAAVREVAEETNLSMDDLIVDSNFKETITYKVKGNERYNGETIDKEVCYWMAKLKDETALSKIMISQEHSEGDWFTFDAACDKVKNQPTNLVILKKVITRIEEL